MPVVVVPRVHHQVVACDVSQTNRTEPTETKTGDRVSVTHTRRPASQPGLVVAEVVKSKREALGLSQRSLSIRSGLSEAYVARLESGAMEPGLWAFAALAVELRLTMQEIFFLLRTLVHTQRTGEHDG